MRRSRRCRASTARRRSWRSRKRLLLVFALVFPPVAARPARAACLEFSLPLTVSIVAEGVQGVSAADVDGDGDLDVLSASFSDDKIAWFQNDGAGAGWTIYTISLTANGTTTVAAADVDGDGDLDTLSSSLQATSYEHRFAWHENLDPDGSGTTWTVHTISIEGLSPRDIVPADIDGDGHLDALVASQSDNTVAWHENLDADGGGTTWTRHVISAVADSARRVAAADVDGDGDLDALSASYLDDKIAWYENENGDGSTWTLITISTGADGAAWVAAADVDGDGDLDALAASANDNEVAWHENLAPGDGSSWAAHVISTAGTGVRSVVAVDMDDDGDLDALAGSLLDGEVAWHENRAGDGSSWARHTLAVEGLGPWSVFAADLDGDGDLDALAALNSGSDERITWYRNNRLHGEALFAPTSTVSAANGATSVAAGDVDGDGQLDVLAAAYGESLVAWYEHDGAGSNWTEHAISTSAPSTYAVFPADVDGDGQLDALSANFGSDEVAWYENLGGDPPAWSSHLIASQLDGARAVFAADLDGDGDTDAVSGSYYDDTIQWHENTNVDGDGTTWSTFAVANAVVPLGVWAADVNRDGHVDILSASRDDNKIAWHRNDGAADPTFTEYVISTTFGGASSVSVADIDRDGSPDVLATAANAGIVAWYENDGDPLDGGWVEHEISTAALGANSAAAADLDDDGDLDVISASRFDGKVVWYENDGTPIDGGWIARELPPSLLTRFSVAVADIDGDGHLDALSAAYSDDNLSWHHNLGTRVHDDGFDSDGATTACWSTSVPPVP